MGSRPVHQRFVSSSLIHLLSDPFECGLFSHVQVLLECGPGDALDFGKTLHRDALGVVVISVLCCEHEAFQLTRREMVFETLEFFFEVLDGHR